MGPVTRLSHSGPYYLGRPFYDVSGWFARAYDEAVAPEEADRLLAVNPNFKAFTYKSGTDTYRTHYNGEPHADGLWYDAISVGLGIDPEAAWCHWADSTAIVWWGNDTTFYSAGTKVEVYHSGHQNAGFRYLHSFVPEARPAHLQFHTELMARRTPGGNLYAGLFMDNSGNVVYNWGLKIVTGGTVAEASAKIGSATFNTWHWSNYREYLPQLRAALNARGQLLGINSSNSWTEDYLDLGVADRLMQEFVGNPIRDHFPSVMEVARRHRKAAELGIGINTSSSPETTGVNWPTMQYGVLCMHLVTHSSTSLMHIQDWTGPTRPDWAYRIVSPAEAVDLGKPLEEAWVAARGVSPGGNGYELVRRAFENGVVYVRIRSPWNAPVTDKIQIRLGRGMAYITPQGTRSYPALVDIPNGGGAIFVIDRDAEPTEPIKELPKAG